MKKLFGSAMAVGAMFALGACAQILGYQEIPDATPDAGGLHGSDAHEAGKPDATTDGKRDTGTDGGDASTDLGSIRPPDAQVNGGCDVGASRCLANGLGTETCQPDGGWSEPSLCRDGGVCFGGACTCIPTTTRCVGQTFEQCRAGPEGGLGDAAPGWSTGTTCDSGLCSLAGCQTAPPSCTTPAYAGIGDCYAPDANVQSCCTANEVPGGTFDLGYVDVAPDDDPHHSATVSPLRLDRFEVTVGRFRQFLAAIGADGGGWRPADGSGKHTHLNAGRGLIDRAFDGGVVFERGWDPSWDSALDGVGPSDFRCGSSGYATLDPVATSDVENKPVNCVTWIEAYAFCIWDGGFLPSEAEWNFAAAGGAEQRYYPWSSSAAAGQAPSAPCSNADFTNGSPCNDGGAVSVGLTSRGDGGDSLWAQADMAGNVAEWTLDVYSGGEQGYAASCVDCAFLTSDGGVEAGAVFRVLRGGAFYSVAADIRTSVRGDDYVADHSIGAGIRCARSP